MDISKIEIIPIKGIPIIKKGDDISDLIVYAIKNEKENKSIGNFQDGDILIVSHTALCKAKGYIISLKDIKVSKLAKFIATQRERSLVKQKQDPNVKKPKSLKINPALIQVILDQSTSIIRSTSYLITESLAGCICSNSGVDKSNIEGINNYAFLPHHPHLDAKLIRERIFEITQKKIAVIIIDSQGRPFRKGTIGVAIGWNGISPFLDYRGKTDLYGYVLKDKISCIADELASAAQLVMGESNEAIPVAIIRGYRYNLTENKTEKILRTKIKDMFRPAASRSFLDGFRRYEGIFNDKNISKSIADSYFEILNILLSQMPQNNYLSKSLNKEKTLTKIKAYNEKTTPFLILEVRSKYILNNLKKMLNQNITSLVDYACCYNSTNKSIINKNYNSINNQIKKLAAQINSTNYMLLIFQNKSLKKQYINTFKYSQNKTTITDLMSLYFLLPWRLFEIYANYLPISPLRKNKTFKNAIVQIISKNMAINSITDSTFKLENEYKNSQSNFDKKLYRKFEIASIILAGYINYSNKINAEYFFPDVFEEKFNIFAPTTSIPKNELNSKKKYEFFFKKSL
ncbi:MAG: coenzyme F420-0:L-glutamate ligase [Promethearchaeota archaeon]